MQRQKNSFTSFILSGQRNRFRVKAFFVCAFTIVNVT